MSSSNNSNTSNQSEQSQVSTANTSPVSADKYSNNDSNTSNNSQDAYTFEKRHRYPASSTTTQPQSAFSSFSPNQDSFAQPANKIKHYHENQPGTICECDSPPRLSTVNSQIKIQTPASALSTQNSFENIKIGAQLPFTNDTNIFNNNNTNTTTTNKDQLKRNWSSHEFFKETPFVANYTPAVPLFRTRNYLSSASSSNIASSTLKFTSEEQARETIRNRNNYSLPPSPTHSPSHLGFYSAPFPRQSREVKTNGLPAVLKRTKSSDTVSDYYTFYPISEKQKPTIRGIPSKSHWKPDSSRNNCLGCQQPFTMFRRKHHCRRCGDIFCANDSSFVVKLDQNLSFNPESGLESRSCSKCATEYEDYKVSIAVRSSAAATSSSSSSTSTSTETARDYFSLTNNNNSTLAASCIDKDKEDHQSGINFSTSIRAGHDINQSNTNFPIASSVQSKSYAWSTF